MQVQPLADSGLQSALETVEYTFVFAPTGAVATNGSIIPLCRAQAAAAAKAYLILGNGDNSTAKLSAAQSLALVAKPLPQAGTIGEFSPKDSELANVATGLKAFTDGIEALADGKRAFVVAVGGIELKDVLSVTVDQILESGPATGSDYRGAVVNPQKLYEATVLGSTNKLLKDATTEVSLATDKAVFSPRWKFVAASFNVVESDNVTLAAGQAIVVRVRCAV